MTDTAQDAAATAVDKINSKLPRGLRNNNPGNLRKSGVKWVGKVGNDGAFEKFDTMRNGVRAMAVNIRTSIRKYGTTTVAKLIQRWAPDSDGNDSTSYATMVARAAGISKYTDINWSDKVQLARIIDQMIKVENGSRIDADIIKSAISNL